MTRTHGRRALPQWVHSSHLMTHAQCRKCWICSKPILSSMSWRIRRVQRSGAIVAITWSRGHYESQVHKEWNFPKAIMCGVTGMCAGVGPANIGATRKQHFGCNRKKSGWHKAVEDIVPNYDGDMLFLWCYAKMALQRAVHSHSSMYEQCGHEYELSYSNEFSVRGNVFMWIWNVYNLVWRRWCSCIPSFATMNNAAKDVTVIVYALHRRNCRACEQC